MMMERIESLRYDIEWLLYEIDLLRRECEITRREADLARRMAELKATKQSTDSRSIPNMHTDECHWADYAYFGAHASDNGEIAVRARFGTHSIDIDATKTFRAVSDGVNSIPLEFKCVAPIQSQAYTDEAAAEWLRCEQSRNSSLATASIVEHCNYDESVFEALHSNEMSEKRLTNDRMLSGDYVGRNEVNSTTLSDGGIEWLQAWSPGHSWYNLGDNQSSSIEKTEPASHGNSDSRYKLRILFVITDLLKKCTTSNGAKGMQTASRYYRHGCDNRDVFKRLVMNVFAERGLVHEFSRSGIGERPYERVNNIVSRWTSAMISANEQFGDELLAGWPNVNCCFDQLRVTPINTRTRRVIVLIRYCIDC